MSDYGKAIASDTFRIERLLPGPIERIWAYLTESEKRKQWFAAGEMELRIGATINFWFQHSNLAPPDELVPEKFKLPNQGMASTATITQVDPPRLLAFQWGEGEVIFSLEPRGNQVLVSVTHRKLPNREELVDVAGGWHKHLDVLADILHGRGRQPFWPKIAELEVEYDKRLPRIEPKAASKSGVTSASSPLVVVRHRFAASAERVFDAFLDPARAGRFMFATPTGQIIRAEIDPRVGGKYLFVDRRGDQDADHGGEYLEIIRPRRLVFTLRVPASSPEADRVEIDVVPTTDGCELTLTHEMKPKWIEMHGKVMEGWTMILNSAEKVI